MNRDYKIGALVHSSLVASIVRDETQHSGCDISIMVTSYDNALEDAATLFDRGMEAVLCHGGFRESVFKKFGRRIIFIERSEIDLVRALSRARILSRSIALTAHVKEARDIEFMERLLDISILPIRYESPEELEQKINNAVSQGIRVFVGGGGSAKMVRKLGCDIVLDEPQPINIRNALQRGLVIAENIRMQQSNIANIQTMLQYVREGVICLNSKKEMVYHNEKAMKLLRVKKEEDLARFYLPLKLETVLSDHDSRIDQLVSINGLNLIVNSLPLQMAGSDAGAVCFIQDVRTIQKIHREIEKNLHSRGFATSYTVDDLRGKSPAIQTLKKHIINYGPTDISIFINGETGTGKELTAHGLHAASRRAMQPFVSVNCAALPDSLLASELFGYEDGAFTGAKRSGKIGLFELANGGSIFLDEIGDMSPSVQMGLLRVLDTKEIMRLGGDRFIPINVRVICASHKQLGDLVKLGTFRKDLYFRLAGLCIDVPPLRDRMEDIPLLLANLLSRYHRSEKVLSGRIWDRINNYSWPGNVRELLAVIEAYLVILKGDEADTACFEEIFRNRDQFFGSARPTLAEKVALFRHAEVAREIALQDGDYQLAAKRLGISMSSLRRIMKKEVHSD